MAEMKPVVIDLVNRPQTLKILSTVNNECRPHSLICKGMLTKGPSTILVGQVLMYKTIVNFNSNPYVEFLLVNGAIAYAIQAKVVRSYKDPECEEMKRMSKVLERYSQVPRAVWEFEVLEVFDEGLTRQEDGCRV